MRFERCSFGSIREDGESYNHDVVTDRGKVRKRKKKASKKFLEAFRAVKAGSQRRKIKLMILRTAEAIGILKKAERAETNAILHVTS